MSGRNFIIIDLAHMLARTRFVTTGDVDTAIGLCLHVTISSIKQAAKKYNADHVVIACEGKSWRKAHDPKYKLNRAVKRDAATPKEKKENDLFYAAFNEFQAFMNEKTNCTVLQHSTCEADDMIGGWIQTHSKDNHVLISGDSDFYQLIAPNVTIYDGVNRKTINESGVFDEKNKPILNKKTKEPLKIDPEYVLFLKIVRGDTSDNIFSAYPGVRETKILAAYNDRHKKGFDWNQLMLARWTDHEGKEHLVKDRFAHNKMLIDLTCQPDKIKQNIAETIAAVYNTNKSIKGADVGFSFMKFAAKYELNNLVKDPADIVNMLKKKLVAE